MSPSSLDGDRHPLEHRIQPSRINSNVLHHNPAKTGHLPSTFQHARYQPQVSELVKMISGLAHVNMLVPPGTLDLAEEFYGGTLGLKSRPVPAHMKGNLAWFDIGSSGQQVHIAFGFNEERSSRHPCFKIESPEALLQLRQRIWEHHQRGGDAAPREADKPGERNSGDQGVEYPQRFFARDYAGNRLEFSL